MSDTRYCRDDCKRTRYSPDLRCWVADVTTEGEDPHLGLMVNYCPSCGTRLNADGTTTERVDKDVATTALCNGTVRCGTCDLDNECVVKDGTCEDCAKARLAEAERAKAWAEQQAREKGESHGTDCE